MYASPFNGVGVFSLSSSSPMSPGGVGRQRKRLGLGDGEVVVRSWNHIKQAEEQLLARRGTSTSASRQHSFFRSGPLSPTSEPGDATEMIANCRDDMNALWEDKLVQEVLVKRNVTLADSAELWVHIFFPAAFSYVRFTLLSSPLSGVDPAFG
jgi:hypothetical protein